MTSETYRIAPPPIYKSDNCCDCTCCCLHLECIKTSINTEIVIVRAIALYCILIGVIGITLTCLDPVPNLTYTFPYSRESHNWDCMHFQAYGLTIGIIIIIYAFVINKLRLRACVLLSSLFVPFIVLITFSTRDAVSTNSYALTNEGYPISGISCGTYMYDHHKMGLFGSWIYTIGFVGPFVVWILCVLIYLLVYGVLYLLSCKSVCPEINQSVEENC